MLYYYGEYSGTWDTETYPYVKLLVRFEFGTPELPYSFQDALTEKPSNVKYTIKNAIGTPLLKGTVVYDSFIAKWWVVDSDTSELMDTIGGITTYEHDLDCKDAFEFLNAVELPNCAFKTGRYTNATFFNRLFSISKFQAKVPIATITMTGMSTNKKNSFKSYDGYTLATAVRDLGKMNGYIPTLTFTTAVYSSVGHPLHGLTYLSALTIAYISRIGLGNVPSALTTNDMYEQNKGGSENYCVTVVSDIKNARSSVVNKYPNFGGVSPFSPNVAEVSHETAEIKLPSKIDEIISVTAYQTGAIKFYERADYEEEPTPTTLSVIRIDNCVSKEQFISNLEGSGYSWSNGLSSGDKLIIKEALPDPDQFTVYNSDGADTFDESVYIHNHYRGLSSTTGDKQIYLKNKVYRDAINDAHKQDRCMYWEQGGESIKGFSWDVWNVLSASSDINNEYALYYFTLGTTEYVAVMSLFTEGSGTGLKTQIACVQFKVVYYPQIELKMKYDASRNGLFEKHYNQTGKTIDGYSAGKLLSAYVDESSSQVTVKKHKYDSYASILPLGTIVTYGGHTMIIGERSVNALNTDFFEVDYSLSTDRIGRSEDISADSFIKDTDTPQLNNIIRKQLYRDYLEIAYADDYTSTDTLFMGSLATRLSSMLVFNESGCGFEFNCCCYVKGVDSADTIYYRGIDAIEIDLPKQKEIISDFGDNSIIGYYRERKVGT